jgi:nucleoside-diphosphate-sugar epimerase
VLIHLAWYVVPVRYVTAPENRECLAASLRLLERATCRAVFVGTCFEYNTALGRLREDSETKPTTLYAECKDALARAVLARSDAVWARLFYQYGPWEDERRLIPTIMRALLRGEPARLSPGEQRRDFLHVEDVASALCAVATGDLTGPVNVGSGSAASLKEIASTIGALAGRPDLLQFGALPYGAGEPMLIVADNARLRSTGWAPRYTLEQGLRQTFEWWRGRERGPA